MRRFISLFLALVISLGVVCSMFTITSFAASTGTVTGRMRDTSSTSNGYIDWVFDYNKTKGTATLTLSGTGFMPNYTEDSWHYIDEYQSCSINKLIIKEGVRGIANDAFYGESLITSVTLPDTLVRIGENAFYGTGITNITLPKKLEAIDGATFSSDKILNYSVASGNPYMTSLNGVVYNKDMTTLIAYPVGRFVKSPNYPVEFPETVTAIGKTAFINSTAKSYVIPGTVKEIGKQAFAGNVYLSSIKFENGLEKIYDGAFLSCPFLRRVDLPSSVNYIGYNSLGMDYEIAYDGVEELLDENGISHPEIDDTNIYYYTSLLDLTPDVFVYCAANPNFTIYAPKNSAGHNYAKNYGLKYVQSQALTPELKSASAVVKGIKLKWSKSSDATGYKVYRKDKKGTWKLIKTITSKNTLTYTDENPFTSYKNVYSVRAYNSTGESSYDKKGISLYYVKTPVLKSAVNQKSSIKFTWEKVEGATKYKVYRKVGSGSWVAVGDVTKNYYVDKDIKNKTKYTYSVRAYDAKSKSLYRTDGVTRVRVKTPAFTKASNNASGVKLVWDKISGADSYIIYRKKGTGEWKALITLGSGYATYTDKSAAAGSTYTYAIQAVNGKSKSYRNDENGTIKRLKTPALTGVSTKKGVKITYDQVKGASGYIIYRKTSANGSWVKIGTSKGVTATSYLDTTAVKGKTYIYTVKAYSGSYKSGYKTAGVTVKDKY